MFVTFFYLLNTPRSVDKIIDNFFLSFISSLFINNFSSHSHSHFVFSRLLACLVRAAFSEFDARAHSRTHGKKQPVTMATTTIKEEKDVKKRHTTNQ